MWGGCEKSRTTSYQQFSNHNNIYIIENIENLSMGRPYDRYWSFEYDGYFDSPPEFWKNIYWSQARITCFLFPPNIFFSRILKKYIFEKGTFQGSK